MNAIRSYEVALSKRFLSGLAKNQRAVLYGYSNPEDADKRTPTFAIRLHGIDPTTAAQKLGDQGIFVWDGHFYAPDLIDRLGLTNMGGVIRIGFLHYTNEEEVDRTLSALEHL